jgi:hypothetical protein
MSERHGPTVDEGVDAPEDPNFQFFSQYSAHLR